MRLLIFGIGGFYQHWKSKLHHHLGEDEIVAFIDNRANEYEFFEGKNGEEMEIGHFCGRNGSCGIGGPRGVLGDRALRAGRPFHW